MPTIEIEKEQLLDAALQMSQPEFDKFIATLYSRKARQRAPVLSKRESKLMIKINKLIPTHIQRRYNDLITLRDEQKLDDKKHRELLELTDRVEILEAERIKRLIELAGLRQVSLDELMQSLGMSGYVESKNPKRN